jgi:polar amino acid transport system ATP-binding protein
VTILRVSGLRFSFGSAEILQGVDLSISAGEIVALIGRSGSGKTTLLRSVMQLVTPVAGKLELCVAGNTIKIDYDSGPPPADVRDRWRRACGFAQQGNPLLPNLSIIKNIMLPLVVVHRVKESIAARKALELLEQLGIEEFAQVRPWRLSGGQQQRAAIARAMALDPALLLLDEPTAALDAETVNQLGTALRRGITSRTTAALVVTHNLQFARHHCDKIAILSNGKVIAAQPADTLPLETLVSEVD